MEDIADADYVNANRVCKNFDLKNVGEYHDFYLKRDTILLANVCKNFKGMCLKIYHLHHVKVFSAPKLAWQAALKKPK